ncbi:MAG: T3SS effector HopA1 family protein [Patescibacteria group bacterium]|nr:T3SS effector HopA1 family protein [Patescibacteria group bacterium]
MENYKPIINSESKELSPERPLFSEAVERIKANERAIKLINLIENGFLPSQEDMNSINIKNLVGGLRVKYPTIDDIQMDLMQAVEDQIGVAYKEGWTNEQYEQARKIKQDQYKVAIRLIIDALNPIYEKYGAIESEDIKNTIWSNIDNFINCIDPDNISEVEKEYLRKSLFALEKQKLNTEEKRLIIQIRRFIESGLESQIENVRGIESNNQNNESLITKKELDILDFKKYVENNYQKIEGELQQGRELYDIFYRDFYTKNNDNLKYRENDQTTQELKIKYADSIEKLRKEFGYVEKQNILVKAYDSYWTYGKVNQGVVNYNNLGRFYLNLKPEHIGDILRKTLELSQRSGLHVTMKVPTNGDASTFNRHDKMVIYFDAGEEDKIMRVINMLYDNNSGAFSETGIPRFAAEVKNLKNEKMIGVGFGEEPTGFNNEVSFGQIRAKILEGVYKDAKYQGLSINDPMFNFNSSFNLHCKKFRVNPENPAFNISDNKPKFETIKRMTE